MGEEEGFVFAMVWGDMELNETKLANAVWGRARCGRRGRTRSGPLAPSPGTPPR
jgi:hypothetical protein